ncbi:DUF732 domain-containing protein [Mycobacterium gordonae]|uniref:DUF732 domain-containing protein n=1 Tax=Mycobacterium gordonae TaxID=1778 RepID=UPI000848A42E|nr:DUF732 domain-containing protein [Mycobacterium gordonae]MCV7007966.1 DUF732 domain-containing protein [Mycobacterium gordonae]ODR17089.1 hypothetical protein BHQ23_27590 [Mycobacterium gordonae]
MTRAVLACTVGLGVALGTAATASADEAGFIQRVQIVGHYSTVYPSETVQVGYRVCGAFSRGGKSAAIQEVLTAYNRDDSPNREYYATLFAQDAAFELCPQYAGLIGPI